MNTLNNKWHNLDYPDNILKAGYIEWKYFNFTSPDISGIFVYLIADPLNITVRGGGRVIAKIFNREKIFRGVEKVSMSEVTPSKKNAGIVMKKNSISICGENYQLKGGVKDISWDLKYSPQTPPIRGFTKLGIDPLHLEKISWFIKMPKAKVDGYIKIKGKKIKINGSGYSDANWGELAPVVMRLNWAQYDDNKFSVVVGETENFEIGKKKFGQWSEIFIFYQNKRIVFTKENIKVEHLKWATVPGSKIKAPSITKVEAENKTHKLSLVLKTKLSDPLYFDMPFSIPLRQVVIEQTASFRGEFSKKSKGKTKILHTIKGDGFKEYTLREISFRHKKSSKSGVVV